MYIMCVGMLSETYMSYLCCANENHPVLRCKIRCLKYVIFERKCGLFCEPHRIINKKENYMNLLKLVSRFVWEKSVYTLLFSE